jgi:hypothetical protein
MALNPVTQVRYKTSLDETLLPTSVIQDLIDAETDPTTQVWNFAATIADVFEYLIAASTRAGTSMGGGLIAKSYTVGQTSVTFADTLYDMVQYWRARSGQEGKVLTAGKVTRLDYEPADGTEFGRANREPEILFP